LAAETTPQPADSTDPCDCDDCFCDGALPTAATLGQSSVALASPWPDDGTAFSRGKSRLAVSFRGAIGLTARPAGVFARIAYQSWLI
jgi:hypothetical protein